MPRPAPSPDARCAWRPHAASCHDGGAVFSMPHSTGPLRRTSLVQLRPHHSTITDFGKALRRLPRRLTLRAHHTTIEQTSKVPDTQAGDYRASWSRRHADASPLACSRTPSPTPRSDALDRPPSPHSHFHTHQWRVAPLRQHAAATSLSTPAIDLIDGEQLVCSLRELSPGVGTWRVEVEVAVARERLTSLWKALGAVLAHGSTPTPDASS